MAVSGGLKEGTGGVQTRGADPHLHINPDTRPTHLRMNPDPTEGQTQTLGRVYRPSGSSCEGLVAGVAAMLHELKEESKAAERRSARSDRQTEAVDRRTAVFKLVSV